MATRPRTYNVLNILTKFHAFPDEIDNKFCLVECTVPVGAGAPPNHHANETEGFLILDGNINFMIDGVERPATTGDFVAIPDGAVHAFLAVGDHPARLLIINAPGHMHEKFFTELGSALPDDQTELPTPSEPDIDAVLKVAGDVGMTIVGP
jgi:mannose-6-phosphate isomerase-like protein (cupin superfamily)